MSVGNENLGYFLSSSVPEEIILGILSDFGNTEIEEGIELILEALVENSKNENRLSKYLKHLTVLSQIVKLDKVVEQKAKSKMPFKIDWENFAPVVTAREEGLQEGLQKGIRKGRLDLIKQMIDADEIDLAKGASLLQITPKELEEILSASQSER